MDSNFCGDSGANPKEEAALIEARLAILVHPNPVVWDRGGRKGRGRGKYEVEV